MATMATRKELIDALRSLANESAGFLSMADRLTHGNTNMAVMQAKIDAARAVLAKVGA